MPSHAASLGTIAGGRNPASSYLKKPVAPSVKRGDDGGMDVTAVQALRTETEKAETGLGKEIVIWAHDEQVYEAAPRTGRRDGICCHASICCSHSRASALLI